MEIYDKDVLLDIMIEEVKPVARSIGAHNMMFLTELSKDTYDLNCSCGCSCRVKESETINQSFSCPNCLTPLYYFIYNEEQDEILVGYDYNVIQNDERFLVVEIVPFGFEVCEGKISYVYEEIDNLIILDKKLQFLAMGKIDDIKLVGEKEKGRYFLNGKRTGYLSESFYDTSCYFNEWNNTIFEGEQITYCGLKELFDFLNSYLKTDVVFHMNFCLESMITLLMLKYNVKCGKDNGWLYKYLSLGKSETKYSYVYHRMMDIMNADINLTANTIEEMFNMEEEYVVECGSVYNYINFRDTYEKMKKEDLLAYYSQYVKTVLPGITLTKLIKIHAIAILAKEPFGKVLKYFVRGMLNGFAYTRIEKMLENASRTEEILNRNFSVALEKEFTLIDNNVLTKEQISAIHKKPTLTNVYNLICKA